MSEEYYLERALLLLIVRNGDLLEVARASGLTQQHFMDERLKIIYGWICCGCPAGEHTDPDVSSINWSETSAMRGLSCYTADHMRPSPPWRSATREKALTFIAETLHQLEAIIQDDIEVPNASDAFEETVRRVVHRRKLDRIVEIDQELELAQDDRELAAPLLCEKEGLARELRADGVPLSFIKRYGDGCNPVRNIVPHYPAASRGRDDTYHNYINSDEWKNRRAAAVRWADNRCQVCYATGTLNAHHRTYDRLGKEDPADLTVLCRDCHGLFHKNGKLRR